MEWLSILTGGWRLAEIVTVAVQVCIVSLPYEPPLWIIHPCLLWQCRSVLCPSLMNPLCGLYTPVYCGSAGLYYVPPLWTPFVDYTPLFTVAVQVCIMSLPYEPPLFVDYTPLFTVAVQVCIVSLPYEPPLFVDYTPLFTVAVQVCIASLPYEPPLWIIHPCLLWQCRSVLCPFLMNPLCGLYTPVYCGSAGLYCVPPLWTPFVDYTPLFTVAVQVCIMSLPYEPPLWIIHPCLLWQCRSVLCPSLTNPLCGLYTPVYCGIAGLYYVPPLWTPFVDYTPLFTVAVQVCIVSLPYEPPLFVDYTPLFTVAVQVCIASLPYEPPLFVDYTPLFTVAVQVCIMSIPYEPPLWIIHPCLLWQCRSVLCPSLMNPLCLWIIHPCLLAVQVCIMSLPYEPPLWIIHPCLLWQCRSVLCPFLMNPLCGLYTPVYCGSAGLYCVPPLWTPFVCGLYTPVYCGSAGLYYVPPLRTPFVDYTPLFTVAVQVCIMSLPYEPPLWIIHPCLLWQCRSVLCPSLMNPLCLWIIHPCLLWQCRSVLCPSLMNPLCLWIIYPCLLWQCRSVLCPSLMNPLCLWIIHPCLLWQCRSVLRPSLTNPLCLWIIHPCLLLQCRSILCPFLMNPLCGLYTPVYCGSAGLYYVPSLWTPFVDYTPLFTVAVQVCIASLPYEPPLFVDYTPLFTVAVQVCIVSLPYEPPLWIIHPCLLWQCRSVLCPFLMNPLCGLYTPVYCGSAGLYCVPPLWTPFVCGLYTPVYCGSAGLYYVPLLWTPFVCGLYTPVYCGSAGLYCVPPLWTPFVDYTPLFTVAVQVCIMSLPYEPPLWIIHPCLLWQCRSVLRPSLCGLYTPPKLPHSVSDWHHSWLNVLRACHFSSPLKLMYSKYTWHVVTICQVYILRVL